MPQTVSYSIDIDAIRGEACALVKKGVICSRQPIYTLCRFIPPRDWECFEIELERHDFLLRDSIIDLIGPEEWESD